MNEPTHGGPNEPLEFKILELKPDGFAGMAGMAWFSDRTRLGADDELEVILNDHGGDGWDVVQYIPPGLVSGRIILRRRAR